MRRVHGNRQVLHAAFDEFLDQRLHRGARQQKAALRLQHAAGHIMKAELGPALPDLISIEFLMLDSGVAQHAAKAF